MIFSSIFPLAVLRNALIAERAPVAREQ